MSYVKIGVAGPVGSGKTALIEILSRKMAGEYSIAVITNDIYTKEDAQFLARNSVLPEERIIGVETGGCPHTAIREDASMNIEAVDEMLERFRVYDREPWRSRNLRVMPVDNYLVFYIPEHETKIVTVLRVMYGGRDIDAQLRKMQGN